MLLIDSKMARVKIFGEATSYEVENFFKAAIGYVTSINPKTNKPLNGNKEARGKLNLCRSITGMFKFGDNIPYNVSRIKELIGNISPNLRKRPSLFPYHKRLEELIRVYERTEKIQVEKPQIISIEKSVEPEYISTTDALGEKRVRYGLLYEEAKNLVIKEFKGKIDPPVLEKRLKLMEEGFDNEFGGADGLMTRYDAQHSDLLLNGKKVEQKGYLRMRAMRTIRGCLRNGFHDLNPNLSPSGLVRAAVGYEQIKTDSPNAQINGYATDGGIELKVIGSI